MQSRGCVSALSFNVQQAGSPMHTQLVGRRARARSTDCHFPSNYPDYLCFFAGARCSTAPAELLPTGTQFNYMYYRFMLYILVHVWLTTLFESIPHFFLKPKYEVILSSNK